MKDIQFSIAIIMTLAGLFGMWVHFLIVKRDRRVIGGFLAYMLAANPKGTGITAFAYFASIGGLFAIGAFDGLNMGSAIIAFHNGILYGPLAQGVATAVTAGYMCDSMLNSGGSTK